MYNNEKYKGLSVSDEAAQRLAELRLHGGHMPVHEMLTIVERERAGRGVDEKFAEKMADKSSKKQVSNNEFELNPNTAILVKYLDQTLAAALKHPEVAKRVVANLDKVPNVVFENNLGTSIEDMVAAINATHSIGKAEMPENYSELVRKAGEMVEKYGSPEYLNGAYVTPREFGLDDGYGYVETAKAAEKADRIETFDIAGDRAKGALDAEREGSQPNHIRASEAEQGINA